MHLKVLLTIVSVVAAATLSMLLTPLYQHCESTNKHKTKTRSLSWRVVVGKVRLLIARENVNLGGPRGAVVSVVMEVVVGRGVRPCAAKTMTGTSIYNDFNNDITFTLYLRLTICDDFMERKIQALSSASYSFRVLIPFVTVRVREVWCQVFYFLLYSQQMWYS